MADLIVAAAQACSRRGDVAVNVAHHCELAERAAEEGVQGLVFPELSLTGYELDLADALAFTPGDSRLAPLVGVVEATGVALVVGAPIRLDTGLHIGAFVLEPGKRSDIVRFRPLADGSTAVRTVWREGHRVS